MVLRVIIKTNPYCLPKTTVNGGLLLMVNSYMQNNVDLMVLASMKNDGVYVGDLLFERMHY